MILSSELPERCQQCAKSMVSNVHNNCRFCQDIGFQEEVLCYLNRCIQDPADFKCHAFQPLLTLIDSSGTKEMNVISRQNKALKAEPIKRFPQTDKIKYQRALALQKLHSDPERVFIDIRYRFAWNVTHRQAVFNLDNDIPDFVNNTLSDCNKLVGGFVSLLWLAPDHIHVHVDSNGEHSVEAMVKDIKRFLGNTILERFARIKENVDKRIGIWDAAYFSETIG
jgi:REP element-mobilizing transposase RayT